MIIGLRVVKTVISILISITIARRLHLEPDHFAGIVSMLAVQPSVYRSLRHSLSHIASALFSSILGIAAAFAFGNGSLIIAVVVLVVMTVHVKLRRTDSLALAAIVAINTLGTSDELTGSGAAYNQFLLVLIGMTVGTAVNAVRKPVHRERQEVLLEKSEGMLRVLLYFIQNDIRIGRMTPYKPDMVFQINEVRSYIEKGKELSQLIREDHWLGRKRDSGTEELFRSYETMVERIRDLVKALQRADLTHPEAMRLYRYIGLVAAGQERFIRQGNRMPLLLLLRAGLPRKAFPITNHDELSRIYPYYQAYQALAEYLRELAVSRPMPERASKPAKSGQIDARYKRKWYAQRNTTG